jgi:5-methylcytosine-specific restriction endonuclease McrBC regulatory subunit McrC
MGVSCSPDNFQEKMYDLMQYLIFLRTYLDDLLFISCSTFEDHLEKLECVQKILSDKGLRVNLINQPFVLVSSRTSDTGSYPKKVEAI